MDTTTNTLVEPNGNGLAVLGINDISYSQCRPGDAGVVFLPVHGVSTAKIFMLAKSIKFERRPGFKYAKEETVEETVKITPRTNYLLATTIHSKRYPIDFTTYFDNSKISKLRRTYLKRRIGGVLIGEQSSL